MGESYVHRYARTLAGQLGISAHSYRQHKSRHLIIQTLISVRWNQVWNHVSEASDTTVGKLARSGLGNFFEIPKERVKMVDVHRDDDGNILPWMNLGWSGASMVTQVATTAIIAAMAEHLWAECESQRSRDRSFEHTSELSEEIKAHRYGRDAGGYGWDEHMK